MHGGHMRSTAPRVPVNSRPLLRRHRRRREFVGATHEDHVAQLGFVQSRDATIVRFLPLFQTGIERHGRKNDEAHASFASK